jgi:hypothetical protein
MREQPPRLSLFRDHFDRRRAVEGLAWAGRPKVPPHLAQALFNLFSRLWGGSAVFFFPLAPIPQRLHRFQLGQSLLSNSAEVIHSPQELWQEKF